MIRQTLYRTVLDHTVFDDEQFYVGFIGARRARCFHKGLHSGAISLDPFAIRSDCRIIVTIFSATAAGDCKLDGSASGRAWACIRVSISPGSTLRKRTPASAISAAAIRVKSSSAALQAPYTPQDG